MHTWSLLITAALGLQDTPAQADLAIVHVGVVDVMIGELVPDQTILIVGDRIAWVGPAADARMPRGTEVVLGEGRFLIPGLWDMHVHLQYAWDAEVSLPMFLAHGVTGVRDMASDVQEPNQGFSGLPDLLAWRERIERGELAGPRLLALSTWPVAADGQLGGDAEALVDGFVERGAEFIKVLQGLSMEAYFDLIFAAEERGLAVAGHVPLAVGMIEASKAGQISIEHARDFLFDGFPGGAQWRAVTKTQNPPTEVLRQDGTVQPGRACYGFVRSVRRQPAIGGDRCRRPCRGDRGRHQLQAAFEQNVQNRGSLQLVATGADARAAVIEVVTPIELFPLAAVLTAASNPMGAIVVQPARLVGLTMEAFRATLTEDHGLLLATLATLAGQSQRTVQQIKDLKLRSSSQRLACYLLELARVTDGAMIDLLHEKKLIASHLGMTPECLSRAFATLRDYGVVNAANLVTLTNEIALRGFGQPDSVIDRDPPALASSPHWQSGPSSTVPHRTPRRSARSGSAPRDGDHHA